MGASVCGASPAVEGSVSVEEKPDGSAASEDFEISLPHGLPEEVAPEKALEDAEEVHEQTKGGTLKTFADTPSNLESAGKTKLSNLESAAKTKLSNLESAAETRLVNLESATKTKLSNLDSAAETQLANLESDAKTKLSNLESAAETQLANLESDAKTKLSNLESAAETQLANLESAAGIQARNLGSAVQSLAPHHESHCTVRLFCFCLAMGLTFSSFVLLSGLSGDARPVPFQYFMILFNGLCAFVIVVMDGNREGNARLEVCRKRLFEAVPALASYFGRGAFYVYAGSFNFVMPVLSVMRVVYIILGGSLCMAGAFILFHGSCKRGCRCMSATHSEPAVVDEEEVESERVPAPLVLWCFFAAIILLASSIITLVNIFGAILQPFHVVAAVHNIIYSIILMLIDDKDSWLRKAARMKRVLVDQFHFLNTFDGRAIFCIYVGLLNLALVPESFFLRLIYGSLGFIFISSGSMMLVSKYLWHWKEGQKNLQS